MMTSPADEILDRLGRLQLCEETRPAPAVPDQRLVIVCRAFRVLVKKLADSSAGWSGDYDEAFEDVHEILDRLEFMS